MKKAEAIVQDEIQMDAPKIGVNFLRNNSGVLRDATGRPVRFGLGNVSERVNKLFRSSDLIGIATVTITPDMVGKKIGVFVAAEIKEEGWTPPKRLDDRLVGQANFINWVQERGGFASFLTSVEDFRKMIDRHLKSLRN